MVDGLVVVVVVGEGGRFLLVGTTGLSTALACRGPALALPRGSARSFACGRGYEAVSHGQRRAGTRGEGGQGRDEQGRRQAEMRSQAIRQEAEKCARRQHEVRTQI